ncbi:LpqB family beta-propeller domain-containing protein [Dermabacteraceae bacterium P13101]
MSALPKHSRRVLLAAAALAATTACSNIPTRSDVHSSPALGPGEGNAPYLRPRPPADGDTPEQVLLGFLQAGVDGDDDYAVARRYLTPEMAQRWRPRETVTLYSGREDVLVSLGKDSRIHAAFSSPGEVSADGTFRRNLSDLPITINFAVEKVAGEWRIAQAPDGIFLSDSVFRLLFVPATLFFIDKARKSLVPEVRFVPVQRAASSALALLAQGAGAQMQLAVDNPIANLLAPGEFEVKLGTGGLAQVSLERDVKGYTLSELQAVISQLTATLQSLPGVSRVEITSRNNLVPTDSDRIPRPLPGHRPYVAGEKGIVTPLEDVISGGKQLASGLKNQVLRGPAYREGPINCALTPDRANLLLSLHGEAPTVMALGSAYNRPLLDQFGYVLLLARENPAAMLVVDGRGGTNKMAVPWLAGRTVKEASLASDGVRLLLTSSAPEGDNRVDLVNIVRNRDGSPRALTDPVQIFTGLTELISASWYAETGIIALGRVSLSGELQARTISGSQQVSILPTPPGDSLHLAGSNVAGLTLLQGVSGSLYQAGQVGWVKLGLQGWEPAFY